MRFSILTGLLLLMYINSFAAVEYVQGMHFEDTSSKIEHFDKGFINWTKGFSVGVATEKDLSRASIERVKDTFTSVKLRNKIESELISKAKEHLLNIILSTRIDGLHSVRDYFKQSNVFRALFLSEIEKNMVLLPTIFKSPNKIAVSIKYSLYGDKGLESLIYKLDDNKEELPAAKYTSKEPRELVVYTSLIIDLRKSYHFINKTSEQSFFLQRDITLPMSLKAKVRYDKSTKRLVSKGVLTLEERDILLSLRPNDNYYSYIVDSLYKRSKLSEVILKAKPSLFPTIYDSEGQTVYFKNMLDIGKRTKVRFVQYTLNKLIMYKVEMVGENPLYVVADGIEGDNNTDIVIGKEEGEKIFLHPNTIENLQSGRIFLLVD